MNDGKNISVIVPVFNAERCIHLLHRELITELTKLNMSFEIIYVDDFSRDSSWEKIKQFKTENPEHVKGIRLAKNFGQHNATLCGMSHAKGDLLVTIDDDLETSPADIQSLVNEHRKTGYELVYGEYTSSGRSVLRSLLTFIYKNTLQKLWNEKRTRGSSFRLITRKLANRILEHNRDFVFIDELCLWYTENIAYIKIKKHRSQNGRSRYSVFNLFFIVSELGMFSTTLPLSLVTNAGLLLAVINFLIGMYYMIRKIFFQIEVPGFTSIIVSILFSTGMIMICLGIIAKFLSRVLKSQYAKPSFYEHEII